MQPAAEQAGAVGAGDHPSPGSPGPTVPIRPLRFRELLDEPFALIQANIVVLACSTVVGLVVAELIVVAITAGVSHLTHGSDQGTRWAAILSTAACAWLLRFVLRGLTVAIGLASVAGSPIGWRTALRRTATVGTPLLVFHVLFTLVGVSVLALGSILVVTFPLGLLWLGYLRAQRFVAVPVMFVERASHATAVARSQLLVAGAEWPTAGLWLCQRGLMVLLAVPLLGIPWFLSDFSGTHRWQVIVLTTSAVLLIVAFGEVVEAATRVVSYVDRRCRREGLDIRVPEAR
ncbi:hypothetical protein [Nocardia sp. NBC_01009]|uniref:hypothetical protein n=1 Tax=Nocardia sp. NBC_01009 TaxID=2975996 RepID=UPI0038701D65|nr:hypothetical protein OHA42_05345 [Nocardia sp. NBC_01009]